VFDVLRQRRQAVVLAGLAAALIAGLNLTADGGTLFMNGAAHALPNLAGERDTARRPRAPPWTRPSKRSPDEAQRNPGAIRERRDILARVVVKVNSLAGGITRIPLHFIRATLASFPALLSPTGTSFVGRDESRPTKDFI